MVTWKINGIFKADAQKVYDEITSLGDKYTPEEIVYMAKEPDTELHKCFEWDDTKAAHKYRIIQAQTIIRNIVIAGNKDSEESDLPKVRAIVSTNERTNEYTTIKSTVINPDAYARLLDEALRELDAFQKKYSILKELDLIMEDINELL